MTIIEKLTTVQARLIAGSSLVITLVFGLWPDHPRDVDPARAAAIAVAGIAWLFSEIAGVRTVSAHDVALFESIKAHFPSPTLNLLRNHDFSNTFNHSRVSELHDVAAWDGASYAFGDAKLQAEWATLHALIRKFSYDMAMNTFPVSGAAPIFTVHPTQGDPDNPEGFVQKRIDLLNASASEIATGVDAFEINARRRLKL